MVEPPERLSCATGGVSAGGRSIKGAGGDVADTLPVGVVSLSGTASRSRKSGSAIRVCEN